MHSEGYCIHTGLCVCVSSDALFSDTISLYVEMKVPKALVQHGADFHKQLKGFSYNASFKYGLTFSAVKNTRALRVLKRLTIG